MKIDELTLPADWAKWHAIIKVHENLTIHVANLNYTRWDMSFYPVFVDKENNLLFPFPEKLSEAAADRKLWNSCPEKLYYYKDADLFIFDHHQEQDHPIQGQINRYEFKAPHYSSSTILTSMGDWDINNGHPVALSPMPSGGTEITTKFL